MKSVRPFRPLAALAALLALALPAAAAEGTYSFAFAAADVEFHDFGLWGLHPEMKDCRDGHDEPGFPWLPEKMVSIAIPEGTIVAAIEVEADWAVLREGIDIEPAQESFPTDGRKSDPTPPDAAAYASSDPYPAAAAVLEGNHKMRGRPFANVVLRPLAWVPATKELRIATAIRVKLQYAPEGGAAPKAAPAGAKAGEEEEDDAEGDGAAAIRPGTSSLFDAMFSDLVVNPGEVAAAPTTGAKGGDAVPTAADAQYLVITAAELVDAFQELADFRAAFNGVTAKVMSLDTVKANYSMARPDGGSDVQTAIRACVADHANNHGTEYVILGGDDTIVPPRYINVKYSTYDEEIPADVYFGALGGGNGGDGTWDDDKDGVYAETSGDKFDFTYTVIPARIPVRTAAEAQAYIRKLKRFEMYSGQDDRELLNRILIASEEHWSYFTNSLVNDKYVDRNGKGGSFTVGTSIKYNFNDGLPALQGRTTTVSDGELWGRQVKQEFFDVKQPGIEILQAYDTAQGVNPVTGGKLMLNNVDTLDVGYHTALCMGHGSSAANVFGVSEAKATVNRQDFILADSCYTGAFDETKTPYSYQDPCLSEAYLRNARGGAVVYLGGSRYGWGSYGSTYGGASLTFMLNVYRQFYDKGNCVAGPAFATVKSGLGQTYGTDRWNWCSINFQGDPLARFRRQADIPSCVVETPVVSRSGSGLALSVKVTNLGTGANAATVTFEIAYDDAAFASPATVSGTTLSAPGTSTGSLSSIPAGTKVVYVRARVSPSPGIPVRSRAATYVVALGGPPGDILYVDANATGANNGFTWADAFTDLRKALDLCAENVMLYGEPGYEVWVAAGTYVPGSSPSSTFTVSKDVEVYGGFAGGETERSQRNWIANPTILSGEIGDPSKIEDNVCTILTGGGKGTSSRVDGFTITRCFVPPNANYSAGVIVNGDTTYQNVTWGMVLDHCLVTDNEARYYGGIGNGPLLFRNCVMTGNRMTVSSGYSGLFENCMLDHCSIFGNSSQGNMAYECSLRNTVVWDNTVNGLGKGYDVSFQDYYSNDAQMPYWGYGSDRWIAKNPHKTVGTVYKNTAPGFATDDATGLACALESDSFAVDKGKTLSWMTESSLDYLGNPRVYGDAPDIGAIEWFVSGPTAPEFLSVEPGTPDYAEIPVTATLKTLGNQSSWANLVVQVSTSSSFSSIARSATVRATAKKTPFSATVTGLSDNTTYYGRVVATGENGLSATSATFTFKTPDLSLPAFTVALSSESPTRGTVALSIRTLGTAAKNAAVTAEYSTSSDFRNAVSVALGTATGTGAFSGELTRLSQGTTYYVRVTLANDKGRSATVNAGSFRTQQAGGYAPGLMQVRYSCSGSSYPDFAVTVATASDYSTHAVERAPGPFMADIYGNAGVKATNPYTGTEWDWQNYMTYYYEGEMFFKGGVTYNFFHCVDDGVAVELDGAWLTRQTASNESGYNKGVLKASKSFDADGWHKIRIWVYEWTGGKGYVEKHIGFTGIGLGWNTNGCTTVNAANQSNWSTMRDPGDASFFRTLSGDALPSFVSLDDQPAISGTTLSGTVRTAGVENDCTITLYAGKTNCGSNTVGWAQNKVIGTVPSEEYVLPFQWDDFCSAGDYDGWFVIARMTNPSGSYEGWSLVRVPVASNAFVVGIREGASGLTTVSATPRVVGFGTGGGTASVCLEYATDASFANAQATPDVDPKSSTNWLSAVTISGLTPNTLYYVRTKGVKNGKTVYSRAAQLSTLDYGTPSASVSATVPSGETGLTTIQVSWSVSGLGLGNTSGEVWLDYGTSASFGRNVLLDTVTGAKSGSYPLTGLAGETTYHFRVRVVASPSGKVGTSSAGSAQTRPVGNPEVSATLGAVSQFAATLSYRLTALGEGAASAALYYDVSTSSTFPSGSTTSTTIQSGILPGSLPKVGTATVTGLSAETTYYVRVRAVNHAGKVGTSATMTVKTTAVGNPEVAVDMTGILQRAATASISIATLGEAAKSATVTVEYGTTTSYGKTATVSGTPAAGAVLSALLEGLEPETTYYVRVTVKNDAGKTGVATTSFRTLEPNDPVFTHTVTPSYTTASFKLDVTKIGNGAASAAGYVRVATDDKFANVVGTFALPKLLEPGTISGAATGLGSTTKYWYVVAVTNNLAGFAAQTNSFTTKTPGNLAWGEGYWQGGLLQGYNKGHNTEQWGFPVNKAAAEAARWNSSGYVASFAYGAVASYQVLSTSNWTNPYDGATYPMDKYNRMWAYGGQMWMEKGVKYWFAVNFFFAASITVDGTVVCSEDEGGNGTPKVGSVMPSATGWHDIAIAVGSNGNGAGAANNPWNNGSPFTSLRYGTAWNTNGLESVTSSNASQWKQLLDAGDRHLFRARGKQPEMAFLDQEATWTADSLAVPVRLESMMDGLTLKLYASHSPNAWYFEDRWEQETTVGPVGEGVDIKTGTFSGIEVEAGVDWYVSARLYNESGTYDQWTDPVKFTPQIVRRPPAGNVTVGTPTFNSNTATVNVTSLGDETGTVGVVLEYAPEPAFTNPVQKTGTALSAPGSRDFSLTSLEPGKTYYVRAVLTGSALGLVTVTEAVSFTTPSYTPPVIASVTAASAGANSGTVVVDVSSLGQGSSSATIKVFVSTSAEFGDTAAATRAISATGSQSFTITGLAQGTPYFVKVVVTGSNGLSATNIGASFTTGTIHPPAGSLAISGVGRAGAAATATLASLGDAEGAVAVSVEVSTDPAFSQKTTVAGDSLSAPGAQELALAGLASETPYYARAVFAGTRGGEDLVGYSETVEFTTLGAQGPAATLEVTSITFDGATATVRVSSLGDDASSVSVTLEIAENDAMAGATTVGTQTAAKAGDIAFLLSELQPGKTYYLKATLTGSPSGLSSTATASFATPALGAPVLGDVSIDAGLDVAKIAVPLLALGEGSETVALTVCIVRADGRPGGGESSATMDGPGTRSFPFPGLESGTLYEWSVLAVGSNGLQTEDSGTFRTAVPSLALGPASAVEGENGRSATMSVELTTLLHPPAEIVLELDGVAIRTWTDVTETGFFSHTETVEPGVEHVFRFVATAGGSSAERTGSFTTRAAEDWFNVRWGEDGYAKGTVWNVNGAVSKSGGSWTRPSDDESAFDGTRLVLVPPDEGTSLLRFAPTKAVMAGADITVQGSTVVSLGSTGVEAPFGTRGGLVFLETGPMGWTRDGWVALEGAAPDAGETVAWKMEVALSGANAPAIRYTVGGKVLADANGREWLPLPAGTAAPGSVGFSGGGKLGDFRGFYKPYVAGKFEKPRFGPAAEGGSALGFGDGTFSVTIDNASADAVYGVYVCETVDGDYVLDKIVDGAVGTMTFTVSTGDKDSQFVVIVAAEDDSQLADHLKDIEGLER